MKGIHNKKYPLKTAYFKNFFLLIAIPIFLIIAVITVIARHIMLSDAVDKVNLAQQNIVYSLNEQIDEAMIRLSHIVHVNNNQMIKLVEQVSRSAEKEKYNTMERLNEGLGYMIMPNDTITSVTFYMKDGTSVYIKDKIRLSQDFMKAQPWYRKALVHTNWVYIGAYSGPILYGNKYQNPFTLISVLSPNYLIDRMQQVEMVVILFKSDVGESISHFNKQPHLGKMMLFDESNQVMIEASGEEAFELPAELKNKEGVRKKGHHIYIISKIDKVGWKLVSQVDVRELLAYFNQIMFFILMITIGIFFLFYQFSIYFLKNIIQPVNHLIEGLAHLEKGDLEVRIKESGQAEMRDMIHSFNHMVVRLKELITAKEREEEEKHQAEIKALQSQINPHFLVNTLASIRFMAKVAKFEGIVNMAEALIKILSCSFRNSTSFYTLGEELEVLESYLFLMKIRYTDSFDVVFDIEEACKSCKVPRLILQPLVENCIVHGFSENEGIGKIKIKVYEEAQEIWIEITDNGKGMSEEKRRELLEEHSLESSKDRSIGVVNVDRRLKLHFGEAYGLSIKSEKLTYTTVFVHIPKTKGTIQGDADVSSDDC
ncbi:two-component sensor histidine kinase [Sporanaerobium hydrogeniformans]|uniref:Two-component sensor histidine kinase n=1 Tax=Sporanaerobium hydrogeniformans TaxID=3072179 RepID=A0AC61DF54_9FIRM|nr:sensor histidine kinase [Sporanaerobium hydrogeniformans]PHV71829.1 two-component sensor histidine kinase [Sporanaerobium hydrogeniformans]